eukprot:scaffold1512_cov192-Alexandrium_tamarense.AAC.4
MVYLACSSNLYMIMKQRREKESLCPHWTYFDPQLRLDTTINPSRYHVKHGLSPNFQLCRFTPIAAAGRCSRRHKSTNQQLKMLILSSQWIERDVTSR